MCIRDSTGSDANMTEFIIDGNVVIGNEKFTSALEAEGINRSARVVRIWTSDTEPVSYTHLEVQTALLH